MATKIANQLLKQLRPRRKLQNHTKTAKTTAKRPKARKSWSSSNRIPRQTIGGSLGQTYKVVASLGHVRICKEPDGG